MSDAERWTIEVCEKCRKPHHPGGRYSSCIVEFDPAGDTLAGTRRVEVVPASQLAVDRLRALHDAASAARARSYVDVATVRAFANELEAAHTFLRRQG